MYWWLLIGTGAPVVVIVGVVAGLVLARLDAPRAVGRPAGSDARSIAALATERGIRTGAAIAIGAWVVRIGLEFEAVGMFAWWPNVITVLGAIVGVLVAVWPHRSERVARAASPTSIDLRRRGPLTFAGRPSLVVAVVSFALLVVTVVVAGSMSSADEDGHFTEFTMPVGDGTVGTIFFGWYFGVPVLIGAVVLGVLAWAAMDRVARGPLLADDRAGDEDVRRMRSTAVLRIAAGTLLLVLGASWRVVAGVSHLSTSIPRTAAGTVTFGTSFAAVGDVLGIAAVVVMVIGFALLVSVVAVRGRRRTAHVVPAESGPARA
jgi:hypothetical protein